jgi:hypothetical protein
VHDAFLSGAIDFTNAGNQPASSGSSSGFFVSLIVHTDQTWNSGIPFIVGNGHVLAGTTLTIAPGTILKFERNADIWSWGTIVAGNVAEARVVITSYRDDAAGGDTNRDGGATVPAPGDYFGFSFPAGSQGTFANVSFRYGGYYSYGYNYDGLLKNKGGTISISDSSFELNKFPIYQTGGTTIITRSTVTNNLSYGIFAEPIVTSTANLAVTDTQFGGNELGDAFIWGTDFVNSGNTPYGNLMVKGFRIGGQPPTDQVWNPGIPFVSLGMNIPSSRTLTMKPGTVVKFTPMSGFGVSGVLNVEGTSARRVYLTSLHDDTVGGDTDGIPTSPSSTDYLGFIFLPGSSGTFSYATVRYGGYYNIGYLYVGAIRNFGGTVNFDHTRLEHNYVGIYHASGATTAVSSSFVGNSPFGISVGGVSTVNARKNWWGSATGPYHPTLNPGGTGDHVSDLVNFVPWLTRDPN